MKRITRRNKTRNPIDINNPIAKFSKSHLELTEYYIIQEFSRVYSEDCSIVHCSKSTYLFKFNEVRWSFRVQLATTLRKQYCKLQLSFLYVTSHLPFPIPKYI